MHTQPAGQPNGYTPSVSMFDDPAENVASNGVAIVPEQDFFPLLALPGETLTRIVGYLSHRDVRAIEETCLYLRDIAAPVINARGREWFEQFEPSQQLQFAQIAKNINRRELRAWLMQFTGDKELISRLLCHPLAEETEKVLSFPRQLFYRVGQLMIDSPVLHPVVAADIRGKIDTFNTATLSHDASYLVTNCYANCSAKIHVLAAKGLGYLEIPIAHKGWLRQATLSPDNRHILSYCAWRTVKITSRINDSCWAEKFSDSYKDDDIRSATFSPDSCHVVTACGKNAYICSADRAGRWAPAARIAHDRFIGSAEFSPDSSMLVTASEDHTVKIHVHKANGEWLPTATLEHTNKVTSARFSPDGKHIITVRANQNGDYGQTATIFSVNPDGRWTKQTEINHSDRICLAAFSPNSCHAVTASRDYTGAICSFDPDKNLWQRNGDIQHTKRVTSVRFSPNSLFMISASDDHTAKVYEFDANLRSWSQQLVIDHEHEISSARFSADNRHILTLSGNDTSKPNNHYKAIIHSRDANGQWRPSAHIAPEGGVCSGQFNHDGSHVAINDFKGKTHILGLGADGKWPRKALLCHSYKVKSGAFSANSSHVVTIGSTGSRIKVWRLCGVEEAPASPSQGKRAAPSLPSPPPGKKARK